MHKEARATDFCRLLRGKNLCMNAVGLSGCPTFIVLTSFDHLLIMSFLSHGMPYDAVFGCQTMRQSKRNVSWGFGGCVGSRWWVVGSRS